MAYVSDASDPFSGGEKVPSLSWRDLPVGSTFTLEILEEAKALQSRDYETNEPAFWDPEHKRPVMSAVLNVCVQAGPHSVGEERSIWAQIPSNLFVALKEAQKVAEAKFAPGGILHLKFAGTVPHENKKYSPIKQYQAKYEPPVAVDPFAPTAPEQRLSALPQGSPRPAAPAAAAGAKKPTW